MIKTYFVFEQVYLRILPFYTRTNNYLVNYIRIKFFFTRLLLFLTNQPKKRNNYQGKLKIVQLISTYI